MNAQAKPSFYDLPPELRFQIYELLVVKDELIYINSGWPEPTELMTAFRELGDASAILNIYYRKNTFAYLLTNLESQLSICFNYQGLIDRISRLTTMERGWLNQIRIVCFFSTPKRVAAAKEGIDSWLAEKDRHLKDGVLQFTKQYWSKQPDG